MLAFASLSQLAPFILSNSQSIWLFYNSYIIIDVSFWGYIFYVSQTNQYLKLFIAITSLIHISISIYLFTKYGIETRFYNELVCLDSFAQVMWVLIYFFNLYYRNDVQALEKKPMFWFCVGILLYAPSTYFLFAYYNEIKLSVTIKYLYLWRLHDVMNMLMYLIFTVGMVVNKFGYYKAIAL
jgi:hypothetical protein